MLINSSERFYSLLICQQISSSNATAVNTIHTAYYSIILVNFQRFIIALYNAGTKQAATNVGLSVVNIGVNNLSKTFKTDFANK